MYVTNVLQAYRASSGIGIRFYASIYMHLRISVYIYDVLVMFACICKYIYAYMLIFHGKLGFVQMYICTYTRKCVSLGMQKHM